MGTCYYFWRDDNQTAFELGKSYELHRLFDPNRPVILMPDYADTFGDLWALEYAGYRDLSPEDMAARFRTLAAKIIAWSEGQSIELIDENDRRIEEASMADWDRRRDLDDPTEHARQYVTGTIYRD